MQTSLAFCIESSNGVILSDCVYSCGQIVASRTQHCCLNSFALISLSRPVALSRELAELLSISKQARESARASPIANSSDDPLGIHEFFERESILASHLGMSHSELESESMRWE